MTQTPKTTARYDGLAEWYDERIVHRTYRTVGWHPPAPWWGEGGIRERLGMRHVPLADLLNAFADAGLTITRTVEPRTDPVPWVLALRAERR
ncbi:hypothetical protein EV651_101674 [Kribbella sp. VKM Ac-2571]|uniref:hypothetical protein n=1 Tax=Kribbella sp. VKM Ac-2571 TaxID=2512222 RepID=UPI0010D1F668|nr:hypothetical protein [Kribbella sp. VKM Ac-2571]TDO69629.1 hypothetical protein EV651_101674 [Kribbella sp. VKM Ac-2571]